MSAMIYRREIDGLRAVAVMPVLFFHAGFEAFSGGFVGVDVFFVISGYLITSIIIAELDRGAFSIARFYERRARRILPALFFVLIASVPLSYYLLSPSDLREFSKSLLSIPLFSSNILFWLESDYFDTATELKPLIHTWTLAVEEQFYVLFPLLLLLLWKRQRSLVLPLLAIASIVSLTISVIGASGISGLHRLLQSEATFYLIHARGWELALGSFAAFYLQNRPSDVGNLRSGDSKRDNLMSALGLLLIGYSVISYSKETPFPGAYALVPTLGTVLIILFCNERTWVGRLLSTKLFVGVGLISYSTYLWHQPLFAYLRLTSLTEPASIYFWLLIILALILAYLSWRFIEAPFRQKGVISRRFVVIFVFAGSTLIMGLGYAGWKSNGFLQAKLGVDIALLSSTQRLIFEAEENVDNNDCHFRSAKLNAPTIMRFEDCVEKYGKAVVVLGDSHAIDMFNAVARSVNYPFVFGLNKGLCRAHDRTDDCFYRGFLDFSEERLESIGLIIYTQAGFHLFKDEKGNSGRREFFQKDKIPPYKPHSERLEDILTYLNKLPETLSIIWLGPRLEPHLNPVKLIEYSIECSQEVINLQKSHVESFIDLDVAAKRLTDAMAREHVSYFSQMDAVKFLSEYDLYDCKDTFWSDGDHWSSAGEKRFGRRIVDSLKARHGDSVIVGQQYEE